MPRLTSVSLEQARQAQDDCAGEDPAHDDEDHTPHLRGAVRDPGIAYVEADDRKQEVEGVEERLEGWLDVGLVGGGQLTPTLEYGDHPLSRYSVEWQPDDKHLLRVGNPRLYDHPYQSPQLSLWEPSDVEWSVILRADPSAPSVDDGERDRC